MPERTILLVLEYDGQDFVGWQKQPGKKSIEAALLEALRIITHTDILLTAAGRTDSGVHAIAQTVTFVTDKEIPAHRFAPAINSLLPPTITVHEAREVPHDFNAKRSSVSKRYRYRIYQGPERPALDRGTVWWHRKEIDLDAMREGARHLIGVHDFEAFRSVHCDAQHCTREMFSIDILKSPRPPKGSYIDITVWGNAFCRHMVRIMAGTLVEVGRGYKKPEDIQRVLQSRDRRQAGVTAPPQGLTLLEVLYDDI